MYLARNQLTNKNGMKLFYRKITQYDDPWLETLAPSCFYVMFLGSILCIFSIESHLMLVNVILHALLSFL